jgi:hypothetical protein
MDQQSNDTQKNIWLEVPKDFDKVCPQCGCHGAHFCSGKPMPEEEKIFYQEIEAQRRDRALEMWHGMTKGLDDNLE